MVKISVSNPRVAQRKDLVSLSFQNTEIQTNLILIIDILLLVLDWFNLFLPRALIVSLQMNSF